ncbi:hydroxypyruvate isomerase [Accumulibacter sp.]|uniref:hydroxypyruvate isomerase n=1 Tax=Accumulibacter sp. TaxID=2053492 RepID=UPI0028C490F7|nr:hydroxypyruvate isomerase [Accumulibacter sp.]
MTARSLKLSANLSFLFTDAPFVERFARAARAGFRGVEYMSPYDYDPAELARLLREHQLLQVLHNLPAGDWEGGERGIACLPGREIEFRQSVELAIDYARQLGCAQLNCLAGVPPDGVPQKAIQATFEANLRHAARRLATYGIRLLVEPINSRVDIPGFWLDTPAKAIALIADLAEANLWLQYDIYHAQVMEGDLARTITANIGRIAHFQLADNPGRHEPGSGEINYPFLLALLERLGYAGWIGCEYRPLLPDTDSGLAWAKDWLGA